jgi:aprataxin
MAIFDAYPKAKYHFLVLPRYPFPPRSNPESRSSIVKLDHLDSLRTLLLKTTADVREQVIGALADTAQEVEEMIRDEMIKTEGFEWGINIGFHAIPSMK